jgi:ABC-type phosphate/phosphonate transport system substrate-binding protein
MRTRFKQIVAAAAIVAACLSFRAAPALAAEYTFAVEPSYRPERAAEVYKPLIDYLQKATGEKFKLVTSRNYHFYWRDIHTTNKTDFAFDEAHFADYRIVHDGYVPLVHAAEPTSYTLVTSDRDLAGKGLQGLVGHRIITMPSPSLATCCCSNCIPIRYRSQTSSPPPVHGATRSIRYSAAMSTRPSSRRG